MKAQRRQLPSIAEKHPHEHAQPLLLLCIMMCNPLFCLNFLTFWLYQKHGLIRVCLIVKYPCRVTTYAAVNCLGCSETLAHNETDLSRCFGNLWLPSSVIDTTYVVVITHALVVVVVSMLLSTCLVLLFLMPLLYLVNVLSVCGSVKSSKTCFALGGFYCSLSLPASSADALCMAIEVMLVSHRQVVACGILNIHF